MEDSILNKTISKLKSYSDRQPIDINLIDYLSDSSFKSEIDKIRSIDNQDEQKRLKTLLPAVMISGRFQARGEAGLIEHSGLISFDIDHVPNMVSMYNTLTSLPFTAYCARSARGKGYFGIFAISNKAKHKAHFAAMQLYFRQLNIEIDAAPSNVASLRGYSYDSNAYFNHSAEVFNLIYEPELAIKKTYKPNTRPGDLSDVFANFNQSGDIESLLIAHGWTFQHIKGTRARYARPGKSIGVSADYCRDRKILYVFSSDSSTEMPEYNRGYNHVQVYNSLECGGDWKTCSKKLKQLGY